MQKDDHFAVARLVEGVLDVVVQNVHLVTANGREAETVGVRLQRTCIAKEGVKHYRSGAEQGGAS